MKARSGQVALYLVMALLAIVVLMLVNVNAFLAVRSKNRMMNAVDEAAIAAAKDQGYLLNEIGQMNVEHLKAAVLGEPWMDALGADPALRMREIAFPGPVDGIRISNEVAAEFWDKTVRMYFGTDDEEKLRVLVDKARVVGYTRMLRRSIRRQAGTELGEKNIASCKKHLAELLGRVDTLVF